MQISKISKINKSAGWNKAVQVGNLGHLLLQIMVFANKSPNLIKVQIGKILEFNKVCCTFIRETKVRVEFLMHGLNIQ